MRMGLPVSVLLHLAVAMTFVRFTTLSTTESTTPMMVLPVELLEISDTTNVAPISRPTDAAEDEPAAEEEPAPEEPKPAEPEKEPEEAIAPETEPAEKVPEKTPPKPAPEKPKPKEPTFDQELDSILKSVDKKPAKPAGKRSPGDLSSVNEAPRRGVGDNTRMTITIADFIRSQMVQKGCWNDQDDMADAKRLKAVIRLRFQRDGRLMEAPQLIEPARPPAGDPPMQIFTQRAFRAISLCTPFTVPAEYYEVNPPQWIEITFLP